MAKKADHDSGPETSGAFPECCKDAAEKMTSCGPMMEKIMAHCGPMIAKMMASRGAKPGEGPCGDGETHE